MSVGPGEIIGAMVLETNINSVKWSQFLAGTSSEYAQQAVIFKLYHVNWMGVRLR